MGGRWICLNIVIFMIVMSMSKMIWIKLLFIIYYFVDKLNSVKNKLGMCFVEFFIRIIKV